MNIGEFREKYPQYGKLSDDDSQPSLMMSLVPSFALKNKDSKCKMLMVQSLLSAASQSQIPG